MVLPDMGPKRKRKPLMKEIMARVGVRRGYTVMAFIVAWQIARAELGDGMTLEEYADWWKVAHTTAYRDQQWFREAFPNDRTPDRLLDEARARGCSVQELSKVRWT